MGSFLFTSNKFSITLILVAFAVPISFSIKCWVCNSRLDIGCGDPFDNRTYIITDCDSQAQQLSHIKFPSTMCRKLTQKVNGEWRFVRSCAFLGEPGVDGDERYCQRRIGTNDVYVEDCLCRGKDGCNGSNHLTEISGLIFIGALLGIGREFLFRS